MTALTPAVEGLLEVMLDFNANTTYRIRAAETLLSYETAEEITDLARKFLVQVIQDVNLTVTEPDRLRAMEALRKGEARRITPAYVPAAPGITPEDVKLWKGLRLANRSRQLRDVGQWPPPEGWANDITNAEPPPDIAGWAGSCEGLADRLKEARRRYEAEQRRIHGPDWRG